MTEDEFEEAKNRVIAEVAKVYSDKQIQAMIRQAVEQERKRCADVVRGWQIKSVGEPRGILEAIAETIEKGEHGEG